LRELVEGLEVALNLGVLVDETLVALGEGEPLVVVPRRPSAISEDIARDSLLKGSGLAVEQLLYRRSWAGRNGWWRRWRWGCF
jgi:hypothetical protein